MLTSAHPHGREACGPARGAVEQVRAGDQPCDRSLNFNFIHDIAPVASIVRAPNVMVVNPSFPAKSVS
jgi:hypothetical protein